MDPLRIRPETISLSWRLLAVSLLAVLLLAGRPGADGLVPVLFLLVLAVARWRFPRLPAWSVVLDQAGLWTALLLWPEAAPGLVLPVFDAMAGGAPWLALPVLPILAATRALSLPLAAALAAAAVAGLSVRLWARQLEAVRRDADRDRRERYDLEGLKADLLAANVRSARMAELAERARIARDLHDHAGHELTAAHLALQAYGKLREAGDPEAEGMLAEAGRRVGQGLEVLRTTVQGLAPVRAVGLEAFEEICRRFTVCRVDLSVHGDTGRIPVHLWTVLEPCLKEALANAARHAGAEGIEASLDVGPHIARLSVQNGAGVSPAAPPSASGGLGLRNLRQRARAVGGSVTVDAADGFRLVCVLPLDDVPAASDGTPEARP